MARKKLTPTQAEKAAKDIIASDPKPPLGTIDEEAKFGDAKPGVRSYTREEVQKQELLAHQLVLQDFPERTIIKQLRDRTGVGTQRATTLIKRTRAAFKEQFASISEGYRAKQVERLASMLRHARGEQNEDGTWARPPDHKAVTAYERLIADIVGTKAPVEVVVTSVEVKMSLVKFVSSLEPEAMDEMLASAMERQRLAVEGARLLGEAAPPIGGKEVRQPVEAAE